MGLTSQINPLVLKSHNEGVHHGCEEESCKEEDCKEGRKEKIGQEKEVALKAGYPSDDLPPVLATISVTLISPTMDRQSASVIRYIGLSDAVLPVFYCRNQLVNNVF